jgi:hypothetical protein
MRPWPGQVEKHKFLIWPTLLYFYDGTHRGGLHNVRESGQHLASLDGGLLKVLKIQLD